MYQRQLKSKIQNDLFKGKVIVLVGARQVGKTTILKEIETEYALQKNTLFLTTDNPTEKGLLESKDFAQLDKTLKGVEILFIDEAQRVKDIGIALKLLVDNYKATKQFIISGSSSLNLLDYTNEPLTGRKFVHIMYPLSMQEVYKNALELKKGFEHDLIFGLYPEVHTLGTTREKIRRLRELSTSYLYKDILEFQDIRNPESLAKLLKLLALQVGSEASYSELATNIGLDYKTVEKYINLLEKCFVIYRLSPFSSNKRREISKNRKVYFYDLGIRNAIIDNFNSIDLRTDVGPLWENFLMNERMKYREYSDIFANQYFWRTYDSGEIDLVEEMGGKLSGYEFKFKQARNVGHRSPKTWADYKNTSYTVINKDNFDGFVGF